MKVHHKKNDEVRVDNEKKSDGRELTRTKSNGVRVHYE